MLSAVCVAAGAADGASSPEEETGARLFQAQRYPEARASLESALRQNPADARAAGLLGRVFFEENELDHAAGWLEKASSLDPASPEHPYWLGRTLATQAIRGGLLKRVALAGRIRRSFARAAELDPANLPAREALVEFYLVAPAFLGGSVAKARVEADEIRRLDPLRGHRAFARVAEREGRRDAAETEYRSAVREYPASADPWYWMERGAIDRRDWTAAFDAVERLLRAHPQEAAGLYELGRIATLSGRDLDLGEESLRRYLVEHEPRDPEPSRALAHDRLGDIARKRGDRAAALREYAAALRLDPGLLDAREALAGLR